MRALELSNLTLAVLAGGLLWLVGCTSAPKAASSAAATGAMSASGGAPASGTAGMPGGPGGASPAAADPHSFARPWEVAVEHLALDLTVDFEARRLSGRASLRLRNHGGAGMLYLDTRDLDIRRVTLADGKTEAPFTLGEPVPFLGRPLAIRIPPATQLVNVDYATHPDAAALQWLTPAQAGSLLPLLFTQSEAILARTWVPCQDTPAVRQTYEATVRVPPGFLALMSAENPTTASACRSRSPPTCWPWRWAISAGRRSPAAAASMPCRRCSSAPPGSWRTRRA